MRQVEAILQGQIMRVVAVRVQPWVGRQVVDKDAVFIGSALIPPKCIRGVAQQQIAYGEVNGGAGILSAAKQETDAGLLIALPSAARKSGAQGADFFGLQIGGDTAQLSVDGISIPTLHLSNG